MTPYLHSTGVSLVVSYAIIDLATLIFVALRFYAVYLLGRKVKVHDLLCLLSLITLVGYSIVTLIGTVDGGIGLHIWEVTAVQLDISLKAFFASQFFWAISIASFRLSVLLLYIEIFAISRKFQWAAWAAIAIVCSFFVGSIATTLGLCQPVEFNWNKTITEGHCGDEGTAELAAAAFNMVLDIIIVLLPLPVVWNLQLPMHKKVGITVTFGLGLGISAINLARIFKVINCSLVDFTYCTLDSAILTVAEMGVGIMVACVPTLGRVFRRREYDDQASSKKSLWQGRGYVRGSINKSADKSRNSTTWAPWQSSERSPERSHIIDADTNYS